MTEKLKHVDDGDLNPGTECALCPRLEAYREDNRRAFPGHWNAPVPAFGSLSARILVVGLAPGLHGANRTGRPFTGDAAGNYLYAALRQAGLASGRYEGELRDGLVLHDCRVTNAVRCAPPKNKPTGGETRMCRETFLRQELATMPNLQIVVSLGRLAHESVVAVSGRKQTDYVFKHGKWHNVGTSWWLKNTYHCSRYNMNTGRLNQEMLADIFKDVVFEVEN